MRYSTKIFFLYLIIRVSSITRRIDEPRRNFRRHTGPPVFTDWELGLRESVHQALLREHYSDPSLREQLLEAPLLGRQDNASPFGDIAVLARGQLYITSEGFKFVQDPDQDVCTDCHNSECSESQYCRLWQSLGHHHKLSALWTVKRIRHRDPNYGHVYEIEYTISPITPISEELIHQHRYFNYNIPGHIFVIRSNPKATNYYLKDDKWYKKHIQPNDFKESGTSKPGILIGVTPDGYKHVLHSFPGFFSSYQPQNHDQTTIDPKEYELYKKLIESLASKTSKIPHRFGITTPGQKTSATTTKPTYHQSTTFVPQTTYVQVVPITENILQPTSSTTKYAQPDVVYQLPTTNIPTTQYSTKPQTSKPSTTPVIHYYTAVEETTPQSTTQTIAKPTKTSYHTIDTFDIFTTTPIIKTTSRTTSKKPQKTTEPTVYYQPKPTIKAPTTHYLPTPEIPKPITIPQTTIHYYSPIEETTTKKTTTTTTSKETTPSISTFEIFTTTPIKETTTSQKTTLPVTTIETFEVFPLITSTEPMQIVTEIPIKTSSDSINEQLPPPDKQPDTTVPYKSTTIAQPTQTTTQKFTTSTYISTPKEELTTQTEQIPFSAEKTTVVLPTSSTQSETTVTSREEKSTARTTTNEQTTPTLTIITQTVPVSYTKPTTRETTVQNKPTTIFAYEFDSTTQNFKTTGSSITTSTKPYKITFPSTTSQYYTYETEEPKSTTEYFSTQEETPTTNYIKQTTFKPIETSLTTTTQRYTTPKVSSTTPDDFLLAVNGNRKNQINPKQDYNEDDIFGKAPIKTTTHLPETTRRIIQSDIDKALFGNRQSKRLRLKSKVTRRPQTNTTRIIYSDFFTPTQLPTTTQSNSNIDATTEFRVPTDQSLSTSISFQVNKRQRVKSTTLKIDPTTTTTGPTNQTKKTFDDIALTLVNHARSIDYLSKGTTRQPKYRRRNYVSKKKVSRRVYTNDQTN